MQKYHRSVKQKKMLKSTKGYLKMLYKCWLYSTARGYGFWIKSITFIDLIICSNIYFNRTHKCVYTVHIRILIECVERTLAFEMNTIHYVYFDNITDDLLQCARK